MKKNLSEVLGIGAFLSDVLGMDVELGVVIRIIVIESGSRDGRITRGEAKKMKEKTRTMRF